MNQILANRYQFENEIARGAAGVVHRAHDLITGERVAVKVLHAEAANEPAIAAAFLDEAEVLTELNHPGIVRPRDLIVNGTLMALVMDLVEGVDLRRTILDNGPLSPQRAVKVVVELAEALTAIHAAGIVHGDVKPGNILVPSDGGPVRLIDFGVARRIASPDAPTHGTPDYTAPEIIDGQPSSAKSDVYGVGLVLYEALCGRSPYRGGTIDEVLERHRRSIPVRPLTVPAELWNIIEPCLSLRPQDRPEVSSLPLMLRAVAPSLSGVAAAAIEIPELRSRDLTAPAASVLGMPSIGAGGPVDMTPPTSMIPALTVAGVESKRRTKPALLAGAAAGIVALAAAAVLLLTLNTGTDPGVVSEPKSVDESSQDESEKESTENDSGPSEEPSPSDNGGNESDGDSTEDGGTEGDSGDGSDSGESEGDFPGEDLIGDPMPGTTGGN